MTEIWMTLQDWTGDRVVEKQTYTFLFSSMALAKKMCRDLQDEFARVSRGSVRVS